MGAIAAGKVNASEAIEGMRIIVKVSYDAEGHATVSPSRTKTGEGVFVARIIEKGFRAAGRYEARGKYVIHTSAGSFDAAPIQTMWLAPEDPAGIKRAYAEAVAEDAHRAELAATETVPASSEAGAAPAAVEFTPAEEADRAAAGETPAEAHERHLDEAAQAPSPALHVQMVGRVLRRPELTFDLPPLAAGKELVRIADLQDLTLNSHAGKVMDMNNASDTQTEAPAATIRETTGSAVVRLMERVHERIRQNHPNVPAVVIVTGAGIGVFGGKWGHFRPQGWTAKDEAGTATHIHEMFMAGETLAKGARQVLQTMLHESAHAECEASGIQDTSRQGRWHNKAFLAKAQELGLEYRKDKANPQIGYSEVVLKDETVEEYRDLLDELDREIHLMVKLPGWLGGAAGGDDDEDQGGENMGKAPKTGDPKPNTNNIKCVCDCEEPNIIRMSRKVLAQGVVRCDECEGLFHEAV